MTKRIIGVTVGTPMNPQTIADQTTLPLKGQLSNTADINATDIEVGIYNLLNYKAENLPVDGFFGVFVQFPGVYKPQLLIGGGAGFGKVYTRRFLTGSSTWTAWETMANTSDIPKKVSELENDEEYLKSYTETDPTVPAWAKKSTKPTYTADEVGADASGTAETKVSTHNSNTSAHSDIRLLIEGLTTRLNTLANSDDTTLDQMAEVVAYIKSNRTLIESVTTNKVNVSDIIDNLTTSVSNKPLSAKQGVELKKLIDAIKIPTKTSELTNDSGFLTQHQSLADYAKKTELPTKTSQLTNDSGYLTQHQSLSGYAKTADHYTKTETDNKYQPKGSYLTAVPSEYITETELTEKGYATQVSVYNLSEEIVDLNESKQPVGDYALRSEIPSIPEAPVKSVNGKTGDVVLSASDVGATTKSYVDNEIVDLKAQGVQQVPIFVESIEECTDTTKMYVLPDGEIYAYILAMDEGGVPQFTNRLPQAVGTDKKVYNGTGYKNGWRLNSSGVESEASGYAITGYIACKDGDMIRLKGITKHGSSNYVHCYDSSFTRLSNLLYGGSIKDNGDGTFYIDGSELHTNTAYFRISVGSIASDAIITVNEEITYSAPTASYQWTKTGHRFVPADYEDRIITVEQKASSNATRIYTLEQRIENGLGEELTDAEKLNKIKYWDKPVFDSAPVTLLSDERVKPARNTSDKTIDAIYNAYRSLMAQYPDYITETNLGACTSSSTFNAIDMLRFDFKEPDGRTNTGYTVYETKPKLIFLTGIHNEWAGVWALYYALEEITTNPAFADIRRNAHIIVIPCANPYGLVKPLGEYETPSHVNANGVAIHNNFGVDWVLRGSVGAYNYSGTTPYSELETQYIDKVMSENADAVAFVSCHNCDYDTEHGIGVIWASSATAHMCNISFRLIDKLTNAWLDKYGDTLISAIETYKTDVVPDGDYRLGKAQFSTSAGTEQLNATKYGIQGVNVEIPRMMKVFSGTTDSSAEVMTHGAEVYANLMRTILTAYDYTDKEAYYK